MSLLFFKIKFYKGNFVLFRNIYFLSTVSRPSLVGPIAYVLLNIEVGALLAAEHLGLPVHTPVVLQADNV